MGVSLLDATPLQPKSQSVVVPNAVASGGGGGLLALRSGVKVNYRVRLRGDALLFAEATVLMLKEVFADRSKRKSFMKSFFQRAGMVQSKKKKHRKPSKRAKSKQDSPAR